MVQAHINTYAPSDRVKTQAIANALYMGLVKTTDAHQMNIAERLTIAAIRNIETMHEEESDNDQLKRENLRTSTHIRGTITGFADVYEALKDDDILRWRILDQWWRPSPAYSIGWGCTGIECQAKVAEKVIGFILADL